MAAVLDPGAIAALAPAQALLLLESTPAGLPAAQALARRRHAGPNEVAPAPRQRGWRRLLRQLANPLALTMLALATASFATGARWEAALVAAIVLLSTLLAFVQEGRSARAAERLRAMVRTTVVVARPDSAAGRAEVAAADLVPGDIVLLGAGDTIPADLRMIAARDLFLDASTLTGEAMPVERHADTVADTAALPPLALPNLAFAGCHVLSGSATALVFATGADTTFGGIVAAAQMEPPSAFDVGLRPYTWLVVRLLAMLMPLVFLCNLAGKGDWLQALLFAVAVAAGLTPELLPMIVTANLAQGALRMARQQVIVKRLPAIQDMGAMDVLCTDKTGTLTQNRVILERHVDYRGRDSDRVTACAWLNSHFQTGLRNLLDDAVLRYVGERPHLRPHDGEAKVDELPFDFERRRMSVVVARRDGNHVLVCKGAVEAVLPGCRSVDERGTAVALLPQHGGALFGAVDALNADGFRVIAVATRELPAGHAQVTVADESDMVLQGYLAFLDPPKDTAALALAQLAAAGVTVKVLTGDSLGTTVSVCRHVGLPVTAALGGTALGSGTVLEGQAEAATVFARVTPQQKADIIRALQRRGHVVGYLGDGINDTQALRAADVGIAVADGADIAKDTADVILLHKSLLALGAGVRTGRLVFGNIVKYLHISAGSVFGNALSVVGASLLLPFLPMAPAQILLNNLLYDLAHSGLAGDRVDPSWLRQPRRWHTRDVTRAMAVLGPLSSVFDYLTFALLWFVLGGAAQPALFQTGWFVESLLSQTLVVHVLRTAHLPLLQSRSTATLALTTLLACAVGVWLPYAPFAHALGLVALPWAYWPAVAALLLVYLALAQAVKPLLAPRR
ncbi:magnesium-translocating P-type ATPase [[Empedobacter] haloabium]|uniref:Magnesium-transporting ATPase, P-type 1 n=1 Tax=[Empedobacter] haloabium TaxID=592317 RepID=A0ABZ1UDS0_9BURK